MYGLIVSEWNAGVKSFLVLVHLAPFWRPRPTPKNIQAIARSEVQKLTGP